MEKNIFDLLLLNCQKGKFAVAFILGYFFSHNIYIFSMAFPFFSSVVAFSSSSSSSSSASPNLRQFPNFSSPKPQPQPETEKSRTRLGEREGEAADESERDLRLPRPAPNPNPSPDLAPATPYLDVTRPLGFVPVPCGGWVPVRWAISDPRGWSWRRART